MSQPRMVPLPQPLSYAAPAPSRRGTGRLIVCMVLWCVAIFIPLACLLAVVPKFEQIIKSFQVAIPWPTALLISTSHALSDSNLWIGVVSLPLLLGFLSWRFIQPAASEDAPARRKLVLMLLRLWLILFLGWVIVGLFLPVAELMTGISGSR